ncbi:MAG: DUF2442 domain-containing protein [Chloroflexota bacterium]|nr:DUF2442 domain-containing protein [Chloroflexota bacterium]
MPSLDTVGDNVSTSSRSRRRTRASGSPRGVRISARPKLSLARSVSADDDGIHVTFEDGRVISVPLTERLRAATAAQRRAGVVEGLGTMLHWEEVDEDVGVESLLGVTEDELYDFAGFTDYSAGRARTK